MHLFHILILGGYFIGAIGFIWGMILAFRTSIGWGLAFLFLPFAWLIFLLGRLRETKTATFLIFLGTGLVIGGVLQAPRNAHTTTARKADEPMKAFALEQPASSLQPQPQQPPDPAARQAQLNELQAQADKRCAELTQKRAITNPDDKAAVAAFNAEVIQYNSLLDQVKTLRAQLPTADQTAR